MNIIEIYKKYHLPENLLPFGYPAPEGKLSTKHFDRKDIEEIAYWNSF